MNARGLFADGCLLGFGLSLVMLRAGPSVGGDFSLVGGVASGGGQAAGGDFAVDATAGQPAAGSSSSGGDFQLTGGLVGIAVVPSDIALVFTVTDGQVTLTWPADASGYVLESSPVIGATANWQPVTPAPSANSFTTPFNHTLRFFRLHKP